MRTVDVMTPAVQMMALPGTYTTFMMPAAVASAGVGSLLVTGSLAGSIIDSAGLTGRTSCPGTWLVTGGSDGPSGGTGCIGWGGGGTGWGCTGCICAWATVMTGANGPIESRAATSAAEIKAEVFMVVPPWRCGRPRRLILWRLCPHGDTPTLTGICATITRKNQPLQATSPAA